jgi:hypothetical protein
MNEPESKLAAGSEIMLLPVLLGELHRTGYELICGIVEL